MFKGMMKAFKMSCEDVYPLISESQDHALPFLSRMRLKMHLAICGLCDIYIKQLEIICRVSQSLGKDECEVFEETLLNQDVKDKIQQWIKEKS